MKAEPNPSHDPSYVGRVLTGLVESVCRFPRLVLAVSLLCCAVSAYAACTRLEYRTQRSDLVSPNKDYQKRWRQYLGEFGDDNDIVAVVKGTHPERMKEALEALAAGVRRQPEHFDRLFYKVDLRPLHNRALLYLNREQIGKIQDNVRSMSPLLEMGPVCWSFFTFNRLLQEARDRAGKIAPDRPLSEADDQFLTQLLAISQSATALLGKPTDYRNPWRSLMPQAPEQKDLMAEPQYFFSEEKSDGCLAFLLTRPIREEGSFTGDRKSVEAMRAVTASVASCFPDLELGLTGLPVLENDEMVASQRDTNVASLLALAGVAVLYLVVFRSVRYPLLIVVTLVVGTTWALGWLTLTVGHLNILSATFVVMLIGMGDYGVLWVSRYEQNRSAGADVRTALCRTAAHGGPSIVTAATATALAFFAAILADFQAVAELGWIAGSGVLLCALSCFTVLPALLMLLECKADSEAVDLAGDTTAEDEQVLRLPISRRSAPDAWLPALAGRPGWVLALSALITVGLAVFACRVHYDHNLLHLQAPGLDSVKWETTLIDHTAGASWHALSYTATPEDALALKARFEKLPGVSRVVEVASLVPLDQEHKLPQLHDIQQRLRDLPERGAVIHHMLPDLVQLQKELDCLTGSLQPLADSSLQPLLFDLRRSLVKLREKIGEVPSEKCAERLRDFEQRLTGDLAENLHRLRDVSTAAAITVADLPPSLRARYVGQSGKWLLRVFAKECLWDHEPLQQFVDDIRKVDPGATGKPFATLEGLRALKDGFQWAGLYALAAIVLVFLVDFRRPAHVLLALAPLAMGVIISLGVMGLCRLTLNPATIIAFPLILGVGAVYGVHVVHDYLVPGKDRPYTLSHLIGRAILVMALVNMMSFGTLGISRHRGLSGLGVILLLGVSCCMLTALVFLPAVLRLLSTRRQEEADVEVIPIEGSRLAA